VIDEGANKVETAVKAVGSKANVTLSHVRNFGHPVRIG
jgi:hypothetical protein